MSSTEAAVIRPSATPRWLVTTTTRNPAARSRATASTAPGANSNWSQDSMYSAGGAPTLITPSRSRKTVVRVGSATREQRALDELAQHVGHEDVALLDARRVVGGHADAVVAQRAHVAAAASGQADRGHAHSAPGGERAVHVRRPAAGGDPERDVARRP